MAQVYLSWGIATISKYTSDVYHISDQAIMIVESGGNVSALVSSGASVYVSSGGYLFGPSFDSATQLDVLLGGTVEFGDFESGADVYFREGSILSRGFASSGGIVRVSGGNVYDFELRSDAKLIVSGGSFYRGYARGIDVKYKGAYMALFSADASATKVSSGASLYIDKGGCAYSTTLYSFGKMTIASGGTAISNTINSGASMNLYSGGYARSNYISSGGRVDVWNNGIVSMSYLSNSATMNVSSGGTALKTTVSAGTLKVLSGGVASGTVMSSGTVSLQGSSSDGKYYGGVVSIGSGGYSYNEVFSNASTFVLSSGSASGVVYGGTVGSGCSVIISGGRFGGKTVSNAVINVTTGFADVSALNGAVASVKGGTFNAYAGGTMTSAVISGYGGAKGKMYVMSGAIVKDVNVSANAHLGIMIGGSVTYASAGRSSGSDSASIGVSSGGRLDQAFVYGGMLDIGSGGNVTSAIFSSGGEATVSGTLGVALVGPGSPVQISSGGAINSALIKGGGSINVNGGKLYNATVASYGILSIASGGVASGGTIHGSALVDATGLMNGGTVSSGGKLDINVSGSAMGTLIESGGRVIVSSGGVLFGGSAGAGGIISALSGCNAALCVISSGGTIQCKKGANVTFSLIEKGGKITGTYNCSSLVFSAGAIVDFDIFNRYAGNASAFVSDLGEAISQSAVFTLSVFDTQENGTYKLASGAAGFDKTITVQNTAGTELGTLKIGQATNIGNQIYKLELDSDDVLSVSVGAGAPTGPAKSDIDGNGFSDVMFVWTGEHGEGNYQHGYWMNGTSEWQSANCGHPANWDNLGCYDMNGDGKADSVLFGNVDAYEVPSAYIGYYQDGIDTDENWVTIGFLTNAAGIDWKNAVGNLTGKAGANSIVWYAPELNALGVWKDGKEDWAMISGDFRGYAWKLVGCGDFDGDGKDSVLMTYNNGQMFYTVGIDEAPARLGISDWSGWKVCAIGDFSGDKKDDIVLFDNGTGAMILCADGNLDEYRSIGQLDKKDWFVVGAGDYNGDNKDDLLVRQKSTGLLGYYSAGKSLYANWNWVELGRGVDMQWTVIA